MQSRLLEIVVGMFLCLGVAAILLLTFQVSDLKRGSEKDSYKIVANFENIGGLKVGSSVNMSGVRIGRVTDISIDKYTFEAAVTMAIENSRNDLPKDSSASILTAGLLGENYVGIEAGGDTRTLKEGDKLLFAESALVLEQVIGQFLFSQSKDEEE